MTLLNAYSGTFFNCFLIITIYLMVAVLIIRTFAANTGNLHHALPAILKNWALNKWQ